MLWVTLSIFTAAAVASRDVFVRYISSSISAAQIMALEMFWAIPLMAFGLSFVQIPPLDQTFWWTFIVSLPINGLAYYLYVLAITGPTAISLSLPMLAFTPFFMILSGSLILDESITNSGALGISFIVLGSYVLNIERARDGVLRPLVSIFSNTGSRQMLAVAFIFSFAAVIGKKAILHSSALFFSFSFFLVFNILALIILFWARKFRVKDLFNHNCKSGLLLGSLLSIHVGLHGLAISIATAAYMVALKRTSILMALLMGWWFFKEKNIMSRGIGALLMFIGALYISLQPL